MLLYYITDRTQLAGDEEEGRRSLLSKIADASRAGIDFIQLREKDLPTRELEELARAAVSAVRQHSQKTKLLINSRTDIALSCGADGVHLPANDISARDVRKIWKQTVASAPPHPIITVSCHSIADVARAASEGADFALFAPVFEKRDTPQTKATGLDVLRDACRQPIPVLALGGVTLENAGACIGAGAAGIAGIRLFQQNDVPQIVRALRP